MKDFVFWFYLQKVTKFRQKHKSYSAKNQNINLSPPFQQNLVSRSVLLSIQTQFHLR